MGVQAGGAERALAVSGAAWPSPFDLAAASELERRVEAPVHPGVTPESAPSNRPPRTFDQDREIGARYALDSLAHGPNRQARADEWRCTVTASPRRRHRPPAVRAFQLQQESRHLRCRGEHLPCPIVDRPFRDRVEKVSRSYSLRPMDPPIRH